MMSDFVCKMFVSNSFRAKSETYFIFNHLYIPKISSISSNLIEEIAQVYVMGIRILIINRNRYQYRYRYK